MSAPYACEDCARPMYSPRSPQVCDMCLDRRAADAKRTRRKFSNGKKVIEEMM